MKGRHRAGDTVLIHAKVTDVDEGNIVEVDVKDAEGNVIGKEITGDSFVHLSALGNEFSVSGNQLADPIGAITAGEPVAEEASEEGNETAANAAASSDSAQGSTAADSAATDAPVVASADEGKAGGKSKAKA